MILASTTVFAQQGPPPQGGHQGPPSPQERLNHINQKLNKELSLSAEQQKKVDTAFAAFFAQMDKLRGKNPPPPPPPVKKEDADRLEKQRDEQIKKVLTPAQYQKFVSIEQSLRPPHPKGPRGQGNDAPPPPPQAPAKQ